MSENNETNNKKEKKIFASGNKKVIELGGSLAVLLPREWIEQHNLKKGDEVAFVANSDLRFLSPKNTEKVYSKLSEFAQEPV